MRLWAITLSWHGHAIVAAESAERAVDLLHAADLAETRRMGIVDLGDPNYTPWDHHRDDLEVAEVTLNGTEGVLAGVPPLGLLESLAPKQDKDVTHVDR